MESMASISELDCLSLLPLDFLVDVFPFQRLEEDEGWFLASGGTMLTGSAMGSMDMAAVNSGLIIHGNGSLSFFFSSLGAVSAARFLDELTAPGVVLPRGTDRSSGASDFSISSSSSSSSSAKTSVFTSDVNPSSRFTLKSNGELSTSSLALFGDSGAFSSSSFFITTSVDSVTSSGSLEKDEREKKTEIQLVKTWNNFRTIN
jgi:hypothetical protein